MNREIELSYCMITVLGKKIQKEEVEVNVVNYETEWIKANKWIIEDEDTEKHITNCMCINCERCEYKTNS
jgi:hypothetical protein